ncbi:DUF6507 family protein [Streptomyces mesophilus]|uniref:DUF6507 family protein n=1 Tax=Streptomyces mesophilus TaxID=1775132 RepID=UPI003318C279
MSGWDVSPSGVESILSLVGLAADDLQKDLTAYGKSVESAALSAGTISGPYCGTSAPVGPVGIAISNFANDTQQKILFMAARTKKTMEGTVKATVEYVEGDLAMAADAQREAAKAPTPEELKAAAGKPEQGGEQPR